MSVYSVVLLLAIFGIAQTVFLKKANKKLMKYLPSVISGMGVLIGLVIYFISYIAFYLEMYSHSVLSENQYLALIICILFMPCLIGSLLGVVLSKFWEKRQILYFIPFFFFIIIYLVAAVMGLGIISVKEIIWLALFLASGFLLSKKKVWGSVFGMIPGGVFVWMSTVSTGQVVNIELPLGLIIIGFYLGCSIGIYRKGY